MRRGGALLTGAAMLLAAPAAGDTLREALARAYEGNPTLTGQRAAQRANDENVPIARSERLPALTTSAGLNENFIRGGNSITNPQRAFQAQAAVNLPIYTGGRISNTIRAAETRVEAGQANLRNVEATVFTDVVSAYENVIRDEAIVALNTQNVRVLETNLRASRDRFEVGDVTRTDVAQSEARLRLAQAQLQSAQATLIGSRENYVRLVGVAPGTLEPPPPLPRLPGTPDDAVTVAMEENPALIAARRNLDATEFDIRRARSGRMPQVGVQVSQNYFNFLGSAGEGTGFNVQQVATTTAGGLTLSLPLFQGGRVAAQVRQAQQLRGQAFEQANATERQVIAQARSAYAIWRASQEVITSAEAAVEANKLSLEGVRAENSVGNRTIIDILNAEQELLNSQVTLVTARRDAYVAGFALLAAMGRAEADDLGLDGGPLYDPTANYRRARASWSDWNDDPAPRPVAAPTTGVPAQDAIVRRALDPALESNVDRSPGLTTGADTPRP